MTSGQFVRDRLDIDTGAISTAYAPLIKALSGASGSVDLVRFVGHHTRAIWVASGGLA